MSKVIYQNGVNDGVAQGMALGRSDGDSERKRLEDRI